MYTHTHVYVHYVHCNRTKGELGAVLGYDEVMYDQQGGQMKRKTSSVALALFPHGYFKWFYVFRSPKYVLAHKLPITRWR